MTALGIKREKKALGYAMQEVKGDALLEARETNLANALTGKVSGVQIIRSSNGPGGSSKIQLRGANSVTGLNQPLIVVDGVPMDNLQEQVIMILITRHWIWVMDFQILMLKILSPCLC